MKTKEILKTLEDIAMVGIVNHRQTDAVWQSIPLVKKQIPVPPILRRPKYYCGACGKGIVGIERDGFGDAYCSVCGQQVRWLKLKEKSDKWIPCSESVPDEEKRVLVSVALEDMNRTKYVTIGYHREGYWFNSEGTGLDKDVKAWMPLPETYEEEE